MIRNVLVAALCAVPALTLPSAAFAQEGVDCANARSTVEINYCLGQELKAADAELNAVYQAVKHGIRRMEQENRPYYNGMEAALVTAEKQWITSRDLDCKLVRMGWGGGTGATGGELGCLIEKTKERTAFLLGNFPNK